MGKASVKPKNSGLFFIATVLVLVNPFLSNADTFIVTSRADSGPGSLREAIEAGNTTTGQHLITFNITGPGSNSITVNTPLVVSHQMTINGAGTQIVNGQGTTTFALAAGSNGSELRGLAIIASTQGVLIQSNNCRLAGCRIGVDWADNTTNGNQYGVMVTGNDNWIGGNTPQDRNLISGQYYYGLHALGTRRLKIQGNYVGTNSTGMSSVKNREHGIFMENGATQCLIGGNRNLGEGNLISGNGLYGIQIRDANSDGNTICGNIIGLSADQSVVIAQSGISVNSNSNWFGLPLPGYQNVISGNDQGMLIVSSNNKIQNNVIGLNSNGEIKANSEGIRINGYGNYIGGSRATGRYETNVISGNGIGIDLRGEGNTVCGNYLGTDMTGSLLRSNIVGVYVVGNRNLIGGTQPDLANIISGNNYVGLSLVSSQDNQVIGNLIGVNAAGDSSLPNRTGVYMEGGLGNIIGGQEASQKNVISGNIYCGIDIKDSGGHLFKGNYIGTDLNGTQTIKNNNLTFRLNNAYGCLIGGTTPEEKNIICGDAMGISITAASGNTIVGNWMGVLANGNLSSDRFQTAIYLDADAHDNYIGLKGSGQGNLIAAAGVGIHAIGAGTTANAFFGNTICASTTTPILLESAANLNKQPPVISYAYSGDFQGSSSPGDYIEVFKADQDDTHYGGSLRYLGEATANAGGLWFVNDTSLLGGEYVTAISTDSNNNSSSFALNFQDHGPTPTPTPMTGLDAIDLKGRVALPYPNPAKDQVHFLMHLAKAGEVKINIYNLSGERIASMQESLAAGRGQVITWMCTGMAPGIYFARVDIEGQNAETFKIAILLK
jgi:hypothetical protein